MADQATITPAYRRLQSGERSGVMCCCPNANRGHAHPPGYLLRAADGSLSVACASAAAAFAARHRLNFPLTSSTPPEAP